MTRTCFPLGRCRLPPIRHDFQGKQTSKKDSEKRPGIQERKTKKRAQEHDRTKRIEGITGRHQTTKPTAVNGTTGTRRGQWETATAVTSRVRELTNRRRENPQSGHALGRAWHWQVQSHSGQPYLLYGIRQPRTLLEMLAEQWEETEDDLKDILTYTEVLKENLHKVWEEAHQTLREAQEKQKCHYNAHSGPRSLTVGQKVLVLLPSSENKVLARWQGPYTILGQITPTTCKIEIPDGSGREQIYHINLLKTWYDQGENESSSNMYVIVVLTVIFRCIPPNKALKQRQ
ncbi:hypothetical protein NDU88_006088 [Pleurodeles waltl]|uniref:Integrase p58-like C-terminal domain-containing protein n=1 Tax=Pleurodeles waltl TaxID=8319 RepID=A0AAV7MGJ8_PLEWA|nr:hypothetical protein NDU88_006088 [Pleurodeles waltl]